MSRIPVFILGLLLTFTSLPAQGPELLDPQLRDLLHEALSGELAKEHVIAITRHHRIQGSRGYRDAAHYVRDQLRTAGFRKKEAYIESYKSDGRVHYQTWQSPSGWDIDWAELRLVEPVNERLVGYPEVAMSLITYSNPGDVTAELVWVGAGVTDADYEGKDVKGKFVLATGYGGAVHRLAVLKYGAAAVVAYLDDERAAQYPDMLQYTGMWPATSELPEVTFGFNLTNRQGERLRKMLARDQKVVLRGQVQGIGLEPYEMDVPVAVIKGAELPGEEIIFSAHLDHPKESANDNASGSAALLDIAMTIHRLIEQGRLDRPRRTLRFLWVPEWSGTMAYIDKHPEMVGPALGGKVLVNFNMDMVGENLELLHSHLVLTRTPESLPSVANDVIADMARMVDGLDIRTPRGSQSDFNYRITPYNGGSDHMMFIDRKIPGIMFSHTDYTHHTSEDTPDKVDPVEIERCEIIAAGAALYLTNLSPRQARDLTQVAAANAHQRLALNGRNVIRRVESADDPAIAWAEGHSRLEHSLTHETATVRSVLNFATRATVADEVKQSVAGLETHCRDLIAALVRAAKRRGVDRATPPPLTESPDARVPVRLTRGPLDFDLPANKLPPADAAWYASPEFPLDGAARFELVNFIDGERTVTAIRNALSAEFGPIKHATVTRYLNDLVRAGVLKWK